MRRANQAIVREPYLLAIPIPTVYDVLYKLNGNTAFSKLDIKLGFHQFVLEEQSRNIPTFITHKGLFRYKRLMFGISSAPELYQHTIQQALEGCEVAYNIYDDIIVHERTVEVHDVRLRKTFERIQEKGLTLNRDKCAFNMSKLTFMGNLLSIQGIRPTESRVEAVDILNICQRYRKPESIICTDDRLLSLRADNGSQFTSEEFGTFLKTNGIQDRTSKPWPQLKRVSRRQN